MFLLEFLARQSATQIAARFVQIASGSFDFDFQNPRDFFVRQMLEIVKQKNQAKISRQLRDGLLDLLSVNRQSRGLFVFSITGSDFFSSD